MKNLYKIIIALTFTVPNVSLAVCDTGYPYNYSHSTECERFTLEDISQASHLFAGAFISVSGQMVLTRFGMKPIPAALTATAVSMLIGASKEVFIDAYTSRNGIKSFWLGSAIGGAISISVNF